MDVWRATHPIPKKTQKHDGVYTFWTRRNGNTARTSNAGWRLDAVLVDVNTWKRDPEFIRYVVICKNIQGSDHCPVGALIEWD